MLDEPITVGTWHGTISCIYEILGTLPPDAIAVLQGQRPRDTAKSKWEEEGIRRALVEHGFLKRLWVFGPYRPTEKAKEFLP